MMEGSISLPPMLSAKRTIDGTIVYAPFESKKNGPFTCAVCNDEVILKCGRDKANHFAHTNPRSCDYAVNESDEHLRCKMELYDALCDSPGVRSVAIERPLGSVRPDVSAYINGVPVAIEIQISSLSVETIRMRTVEYHRKGIYVLWLLPWREELNNPRYAPSNWEKWLHAAYFGHVYYWHRGLEIASYHFEPCLKSTRASSWYDRDGERQVSKGFTRRMKRWRTPVRNRILHLLRDFEPRTRSFWEGSGVVVPDAKLFMEKSRNDQSKNS